MFLRRLRLFLAAYLQLQRIRNRVLLALILISIPPLFILGFFSFNTAKEAIVKTNTQTNLDNLTTSSEITDLIFRNIVNLNQAMVMDEGIRNDLSLSHETAYRNELERSRGLQSRMQKIMYSNFIDSRYVDSVCLYNMNFDSYCLGRSDDAGKYEGTDKAGVIPREKWFRTAEAAKGRVVFMAHNVIEDSDSSFSTVKLFRDSSSIEGKPIGILVINISRSIFDRVFVGARSFGGIYIVLDSSAAPVNIIYPPTPGVERELKPGNVEETISQLQAQGYLVSSYTNYTTDWTFLHAIQSSMLLQESRQIGKVTTIIGILIAVSAIILAIIISEGITRPLLKLKKMMVDWTKGSRVIDQTFGTDEVGVIGNTFKRLAVENEELNHRLITTTLKEREAELRALQAQINPHFLYNTLDSIYWMAKIQNHENIAKMALALSYSFKLSLNKGKERILVSKELQHVEHYLTIQNIRYNHRFMFHSNIEESIMNIEIQKLMLQPLIENAITHGLEPKVGPGTLSLTGKWDGDFIVFTVKDDGIGIEDMSRTEQGYGLRNVHERLKLYYGLSSGFNISSTKDEGTAVELRFNPFVKERNQDA
ncbi:histidine kinase [Paenibacillus sp. P46E]|uniref:sensor histidine kinase n=1 Tax=Paenibacillus sp. P46E TaxID=1349436 RepID=UPI00093B13EF|nr:histidine kinase [Paenibacillus sp. P46E]OKP94246.1 histidine kinase [Paenibacillus sp. P46E]